MRAYGRNDSGDIRDKIISSYDIGWEYCRIGRLLENHRIPTKTAHCNDIIGPLNLLDTVPINHDVVNGIDNKGLIVRESEGRIDVIYVPKRPWSIK